MTGTTVVALVPSDPSEAPPAARAVISREERTWRGRFDRGIFEVRR
jgi:hypothetical protein